MTTTRTEAKANAIPAITTTNKQQESTIQTILARQQSTTNKEDDTVINQQPKMPEATIATTTNKNTINNRFSNTENKRRFPIEWRIIEPTTPLSMRRQE